MSMGGQAISKAMRESCQSNPDLAICSFIELLGVILPYFLIIIFGLTFYKIVIEPEGKILAKLFNAMPLLLIIGGLPLLMLGQQLGLLFFIGLAWLLFGDSVIKTIKLGHYRDILPSRSAVRTILLILAIPILFLLVLIPILMSL